jgi:antitoxin component of MazEF toxin-antitoxin module
MEFVLERKVITLGSSLAITIPRWLAKQKDIDSGDSVNIKFDDYSGIIIVKAKMKDNGVSRRPTIPYRGASD